MPKFGKTSSKNLATCYKDIQCVCNQVIKTFDFSVLCGSRGASIQMFGYRKGRSKLVYPLSNHNPLYNKIEDWGILAKILGCECTKTAVCDAMVNATQEQLDEIDKNPPSNKSRAVDIIPYPVDWRYREEAWKTSRLNLSKPAEQYTRFQENIKNIGRWHEFAGRMLATAESMGIKLSWGGHWETFLDLPHFELEE